MRRVWRLLIVALFTLTPAISFGGPAEGVVSVVTHWAEAFNANDVDSLVDLYAPDATLIGTTGPSLIEGKNAVHSYFSRGWQTAGTKSRSKSQRPSCFTTMSRM